MIPDALLELLEGMNTTLDRIAAALERAHPKPLPELDPTMMAVPVGFVKRAEFKSGLLEQIVAVLNGEEWDSDTVNDVANMIVMAGYQIGGLDKEGTT